MASIVFAWELGGGSGHVTKIAPIATDLDQRGHTVSFISRDAPAAVRLLRQTGVKVLAAPDLLGIQQPAAYADSYAEVLLRCGYASQLSLREMLRSWRRSFDAVRPDLIVADFAPTAMLAARLAGVPVALIGQGYSIPPRQRPLPFTRAWDEEPPGRTVALDAQATASINRALTAAGSTHHLPALEALFDVPDSFICSFPELDHYECREGGDFYGPIYADSDGQEPPWPQADGPRVFGYASAAHPALQSLLSGLRATGFAAAIYVRGFAPAEADAASTPSLRVCTQPVRIASAMAACDIVICQGIGTVSAALVAGRPLLLLPEYLEQMMTLRRVAQQHLGTGLDRDCDAETVVRTLRSVLENPVCHQAVSRFAAHYHGFNPGLPAASIAEALAEIAA